MTPLDPGSVLLAGSAASIASWAVLAWFPRAHRVRHVPEALHISVGVGSAFLFAWLWSLTGWPIAPLQGALFGVALWLGLELLVASAARRRAGRSDMAATFLAALVYGVLMGFAYLPGA
jgi:hypothetical protein